MNLGGIFMKKSKIIALAAVTLLTAGALTACSGSKTSSSNKTFSYVYEQDPDNLDYLTTGKASTSNITSNVIDGLLENFVKVSNGIHLKVKSMPKSKRKTL